LMTRKSYQIFVGKDDRVADFLGLSAIVPRWLA
jgi:hypothetical protein